MAYGKVNKFIHDDIGFNYRLSNISAALGLGQFENYGMPLEITSSSKTEKFILTTKAKSILIEPINRDLFLLKND